MMGPEGALELALAFFFALGYISGIATAGLMGCLSRGDKDG